MPKAKKKNLRFSILNVVLIINLNNESPVPISPKSWEYCNTVRILWISTMAGGTKNNLPVKSKKQVTLLELSGKHREILRGEPGRKNQFEEKFGDWLEGINLSEDFTSNRPNFFLRAFTICYHIAIYLRFAIHQQAKQKWTREEVYLLLQLNTLEKVWVKSGHFPK